MVILVFSDTHGDEDAFKKMLEQVPNYDQLICLGDSGFTESMMLAHDIISVRGNYPFAPKFPLDIEKVYFNKKFFLTHGHKYHVKFGLSRLRLKADLLKADICMFGHTHHIYFKQKGPLILLNPGALSFQRSNKFPSYVKIEIDEYHLNIDIINLNNQDIVQTYIEDRHE